MIDEIVKNENRRWRLSPLQRKLLRDLRHLRGQVFAIALVVACGVASFVSMRSTYDSLVATQNEYYAAYRFADVFVNLKRAPQNLVERIGEIPGVASVQARVTGTVTADLPDLNEPAQCKIISIPERKTPMPNDLHFLRGRYIEAGNSDEIIISGAFADANNFNPGDSLTVILNGRRKKLHIVGVALSPEYVYEIRPGDIFPDNRRFGVIWMGEKSVAAAFDMKAAFNDAALLLAPDADAEQVIADLDGLLETYGGAGAYLRSEQISNRFVSNEIRQQEVFGTALPAIFLTVTAFLLHLVLSRLVGTQRDQIAVLKAFGYSNAAVGWHYLQLALTAVVGGVVSGILLGAWLGSAMTRLYTEFFNFPILRYELRFSVVLISFLISFGAAAFGALAAVRKAVNLPPAEAMRPEPPLNFQTGFFEHINLKQYFSVEVRMILRSLSRQPFKAFLSVFGISLSVALLFVGFYFFDAVNRIIEVQFYHATREDAEITFSRPLSGNVRYEIADLPSVRQVEMFRAVPARLRFGHRSRRIGLLGLETNGSLRKIVDKNFETKTLPPDGIVLTKYLADILGVEVGDILTVEVKEGARPVREIEVVETVEELIGLNAYLDISALHRLMREEDTVSGAFLSVDEIHDEILYSRLKKLPNVAAVSLPKSALKSFNETFAQNLGTSTFILVAFASIIAFGVVYNGARIALSERGREFASLRVLGFTQKEIAVMLLGEQAVITAAAIPVGYLLGIFLSRLMNAAIDVEMMRLPLVFSAKTFVYSFLIVVVTAVLSGLLVAWRLGNLDLIEVLKTRE
jgi:putative ABC transport system permease protein